MATRDSGNSPAREARSAADTGEKSGVEGGRYHALLIAVQEYDNREVNDLDFPVSDAVRLAEVLQQRYTFDADRIRVLSNPTRAEIIESLEVQASQVGSADSLIVFFAGHGYWDADRRQGYWWPRDARTESRSDWISNSDIRDLVAGIRCRHTLLISDACFSGALLKSRSGSPSGALERLHSLPSRKALTSGTLETVPDRSVFLDYLVDRLRANESTWLPTGRLFADVREPVLNNGPSVPQFGVIHGAGDEGGDFIFLRRTGGDGGHEPEESGESVHTASTQTVATPHGRTDQPASPRRYWLRGVAVACLLLLVGFAVWRILFPTERSTNGNADLAFALATQEYFQKDYGAAAARLAAIGGDSRNTLRARRTALEFLAELEVEAADTSAAKKAISDLLDLEPPLITIAPHEATTVLGSLYDQERKERITNVDRPPAPPTIDALAVLPFQEFFEVPVDQNVGAGIANVLITRIVEASPTITVVERAGMDRLLRERLLQGDTTGYIPTTFDWSELASSDPLPTGVRPFIVWSDVEDELPSGLIKASHYLTGSIRIDGDSLSTAARVLVAAWIFDVKSARLDAWSVQYGTMDELYSVLNRVSLELLGRIHDSGE